MHRESVDFGTMLQAARQNQPQALDHLLETYRQYLSLLARNRTGQALRQKAGASDLVQETMLNAFEKFGQFRGSSEPELAAWLRKILANNLAQQVRRYKTGARDLARDRSLEAMVNQSSMAIGNILAASGATPSIIASRREQAVVLAEALGRLSEDQREVVILRNLEQLEWPEVATRMKRSNGAVRMLWVRALQQLRPLIEEML